MRKSIAVGLRPVLITIVSITVLLVIIAYGLKFAGMPVKIMVGEEGQKEAKIESISQGIPPQAVNEIEETIADWVWPEKNNVKRLKNTVKSQEMDGISAEIEFVYQHLSDNSYGLTQIPIFNGMNGAITYSQLDMATNEITLAKEYVNSAMRGLEENAYTIDNVYFVLPTTNENKRWQYKTTYNMVTCSAYFDELKIKGENRKVLVIERSAADKSTGTLYEIKVEYYQKGKGIYRIDCFSIEEPGKILLSYVVSDARFESEIEKRSFPIINQSDN